MTHGGEERREDKGQAGGRKKEAGWAKVNNLEKLGKQECEKLGKGDEQEDYKLRGGGGGQQLREKGGRATTSFGKL